MRDLPITVPDYTDLSNYLESDSGSVSREIFLAFLNNILNKHTQTADKRWLSLEVEVSHRRYVSLTTT